nr:hypothetical protein [Tanacetum cinerariifolium]
MWKINLWEALSICLHQGPLKLPLQVKLQAVYVVPTGRVVVPTSRYVVHAGNVIIVSSGRLSLIPTGRVLSPVSRSRRLRKVGTAQRVESSADTVMDDQEDASKQGEIIANIDAGKDV